RSLLYPSSTHARPPPAALFPYTTLFRSGRQRIGRNGAQLDGQRLGLRRLAGLAVDVAVLDHAIDDPVAPRHGRIMLGKRIVVVRDRKSTRLNSSHVKISYAVFCLKKKKN